jgi:hypothetical protein
VDPKPISEAIKVGGILAVAGGLLGLYLGWPLATYERLGESGLTLTHYTNHLGIHADTYKEAFENGFGAVVVFAIAGAAVTLLLVALGVVKSAKDLGASD